ERKLRAQFIQADASEGFASTESCKGLAENRVLALLSLQLRQQRGDRGIVGLVNAAACNQLIDEILNVLPAECRQRACRNVEQVEVVGNVHAQVSHERVADLINVHIDHDLRA